MKVLVEPIGTHRSDTEILSNMERTQYEKTITDMNQQLVELFQRLAQVETRNVEVARKMQEYEKNSTKFICELQRKLDDKNTIILKLEDRIAEVTKSRAMERSIAQKRIAELETKYNSMHDRMTKVIKGLEGQLDQLDECRRSRDILLVKYNQKTGALKAQKEQHNARMSDLKQKHLDAQDAVKQQVVDGLKRMSMKFKSDQHPMCRAGYAQRRLKELLAKGAPRQT